jgi:hypothetical protein
MNRYPGLGLSHLLAALLVCACCISCHTTAESGDPKTFVIEEFGTGVDLRSVSFSGKPIIPPGLKLVSDETQISVREVYFKSLKTGERIQLSFMYDASKHLTIGIDNTYPSAPVQHLDTNSAYSTQKGITLGASVKDVFGKYGQLKPRTSEQLPGVEFYDYTLGKQGSLISTLGFTFANGVLIAMTSMLNDEELLKLWREGKLSAPQPELLTEGGPTGDTNVPTTP